VSYVAVEPEDGSETDRICFVIDTLGFFRITEAIAIFSCVEQ
jgi:hypothetical protein